MSLRIDINKLEALRQRRLLSKKELAGRAGISYNTLLRLWDTGRIGRPSNFRAVCAALGVEDYGQVLYEG